MLFMQEKALIFDAMSETIIATAAKMATEHGAESVNVRMILQELEITNRVFYNRFHNVDEVLKIVYERLVLQIRQALFPSLIPMGISSPKSLTLLPIP
jgi:AcrR family transcriptional regulator